MPARLNTFSFSNDSGQYNLKMEEKGILESALQGSRSLQQAARDTLELPTSRLELYRTASLLPPPDGGLTAWLQVLSGFLIFFNTW
jgi:hypothetical protein